MDRNFLDIFFLDRNFLTEFSLTKMDSEQVIFDTNVYDTDFLTQNVLTVMWYSHGHGQLTRACLEGVHSTCAHEFFHSVGSSD